MRVLALNAGSSSLKASVLDSGRRQPLASTAVGWGSDATRVADRSATIGRALHELARSGLDVGSLEGVGHRMVHGGTRFQLPALVEDDVLAGLEAVAMLAPLHNTVALDTIRAARGLLPDTPHVVAFDTGFHAGLPLAAVAYPLPWRWYEEWGIRRFGFHGLSVAWAVRRAGELLGRDPARLCLVVAHLGSGCSVTAIENGSSVSTSMGYTPLEGLMMGTRAGSFDPGIALQLLHRGRLTPDELAEALDHQSGLLGVSGVSGDVREVSAAAANGNERAALALEMFVRRAAEGISASASALPTLDCLVFTGGIGENAADLRSRIVGRLGVLGLQPLDGPDGDGSANGDAILSRSGAGIGVVCVHAREDVVIAEATHEVIAGRRSGGTAA